MPQHLVVAKNRRVKGKAVLSNSNYATTYSTSRLSTPVILILTVLCLVMNLATCPIGVMPFQQQIDTNVIIGKETDNFKKEYTSYHISNVPVPCQLKIVSTSQTSESTTTTTSKFQISDIESWSCQQKGSGNTHIYLDFEIHECPPSYSASTFLLQSTTSQTRSVGHVGDRHAFRDGCAIYNSSVPIIQTLGKSTATSTATVTATIDLFWTSDFRHYSNHMKDIEDAHKIKAKELPAEKIAEMFTAERLAYLDRHLDPLPTFPLNLEIALPRRQTQHHVSVPDCGTIPLDDWEPVGVASDGVFNDTSPFAPKDEVHPWVFRPANCHFTYRTLAQLNDLLAGIRVKLIGDSHMENILNEARALMCAEYAHENPKYFDSKYDCPYRNNSFQLAYRFFRGVYKEDMKNDFDAISKNLRSGSPKSCREILGLGQYNVTILSIPHWMFVYETQEGLDDFLLALRNLLERCDTLHPELMQQHVILLQTATARDSLPIKTEKDLDASPAHSWRGIHNHRIESYTYAMKDQLRGYVEGIIPAFEMTLARMWDAQTRDGVHLPHSTYRELLHVEIAAIQSAMKYKRGLELPLKSMGRKDLHSLRWFANLELE